MDVIFTHTTIDKLDTLRVLNGQIIVLENGHGVYYDMNNTRYKAYKPADTGSTTQPVYFKDGLPVATTYSLNKSVPSDAVFTDTKVTSVGNHYTPTKSKTINASSSTSASWGSTDMVTGIEVDAAGHVTGVTSIQMPANPNTHPSQATSSTLGTVKIGYATSGKNYGVQLNSSGQMFVNVPWTDTNTNTNTTYSLSKSGSTITLTGSDGSKTSVTDSDTNTDTVYYRVYGLNSQNFDNIAGNWSMDIANNTFTGSAPITNANNGDHAMPSYNITQLTGDHFHCQFATRSSTGQLSIPVGFYYRTKWNNPNTGGWSTWAKLDSRIYSEYLPDPSGANYIVCAREAFWPFESGSWTLGRANNRWGQIYTSTQAIDFSDLTMKTDITSLLKDDRYIQLFDLIEPYAFKFIDGTSGRIHTGFISQYVEEALEKVGLTAEDCAFFCKDIKTEQIKDEEGNLIEERQVVDKNGELVYIYSLRYGEYIAIIAAKVKRLESEYNKKLNELETRMKHLEDLESRLKSLEDKLQ